MNETRKRSRYWILWTLKDFKKFKKAYQKAVADEVGIFTFEGHEFVTWYAKHLIEYLE